MARPARRPTRQPGGCQYQVPFGPAVVEAFASQVPLGPAPTTALSSCGCRTTGPLSVGPLLRLGGHGAAKQGVQQAHLQSPVGRSVVSRD
jgi:hypothetical protein